MATVSPVGVSASAKEVVIVAGAGVGLIVLLYWLAKREVKAAAETVSKVVKPVANAVNPASQTNIVQKIGTAAVALADPKVVTQDLSLSTKIIDWFNFGGVNDYDPNADTASLKAKVGK